MLRGRRAAGNATLDQAAPFPHSGGTNRTCRVQRRRQEPHNNRGLIFPSSPAGSRRAGASSPAIPTTSVREGTVLLPAFEQEAPRRENGTALRQGSWRLKWFP